MSRFVSYGLLLALATYPRASEAGEVCKRYCIVGYEDFCARAHRFQLNTTHQIDHVVIYVERATDDTFSYASNVQSVGARYPTKIVGFKKLKDLDNVLFNLDPDIHDQILANSDILKTFHNTAEVYIAPNTLDLASNTTLDLDGFKNVHFLSEGYDHK